MTKGSLRSGNLKHFLLVLIKMSFSVLLKDEAVEEEVNHGKGKISGRPQIWRD